MWPSLLRERPELIPAAYALDSVMIELIFIAGPLLTAVIAALMSPAAALIDLGRERDAGDDRVHRAGALAGDPARPRRRRGAAASARSPRPACARSC